MMGTRQIQSTAWLDLLIALQKMSETNCNISSPYFIAHIMRSLTPLENYYNIQYPLKNWWLMRFPFSKWVPEIRAQKGEAGWWQVVRNMQQPTTWRITPWRITSPTPTYLRMALFTFYKYRQCSLFLHWNLLRRLTGTYWYIGSETLPDHWLVFYDVLCK